MINREIYQVDPTTRPLVNDGVATVNDDRSSFAMKVLRYELETFVCGGQYENGLVRILETFLKNIERPHQPGVWVSGFFGSGKSHLVKMLRALWDNTQFPDGAVARGIAKLPSSITDLLCELDTQAKRYGGLHAASGTLGASAAGSVRLALLSIILKSKGLPEQYPNARFVLWMIQEGILEPVRAFVEKKGDTWHDTLDNFYFAENLHEVLSQLKPNLFPDPVTCATAFPSLYPVVSDVSSDDLLKVIRQALTTDGKFPLTAVILDEVQQFIAEDSQKSIEVQEVVETCCNNFGGKLLFIGTGQTAVAGTPNLKKLEGRFTVRVELSDTDVDSVIRQVILAKKPEAVPAIDEVMRKNIGEIGKHLSSTSLRHRQEEDSRYFAQDYPILPVRRRFWENTLRVLDQTGTDSQLRNQLSMVHKVVQTNLEAPLGSVIPADFLFFELVEKLLQAHILPRKVYERTILWRDGNEDEQLVARACALVFLINKLSVNKEIGIRSNIDTLADLLVTDLHAGSASIRSRLSKLLDEELPNGKKKYDLLVRIQDEYKIQTEESESWHSAFLTHKSTLGNESVRIDTERESRFRSAINESLKNLSFPQGKSKVPRAITLSYDPQLPRDHAEKIYVWIRDGWSTDENSVHSEARQAGNESPTIFLFVPKRSADEIRRNIIDAIASRLTMDSKGTPNTPEGNEARSAMETIRMTAEANITQLIAEALKGSRIFQAGGQEMSARTLRDAVHEAAENSLKRLYPGFVVADNPDWAKVYERAQKGSPDALKAIGFEGEVTANPVCKEVLSFIGAGKKGADIRTHFQGKEYGWPQDAIDGAIQVLFVAGLIRGNDDKGRPVVAARLERKALGITRITVESIIITAQEKIQIRKLFLKLGIAAQPDSESISVLPFLEKMAALAERAGGEPPKPIKPDTRLLGEIQGLGGNEQLRAILNAQEELAKKFGEWTSLAERIEKRIPAWSNLKKLVDEVDDLKDAEVYTAQVTAIEAQRSLLADPDPVPGLLGGITQLLRDALNRLNQEYTARHALGMERLAADPDWSSLTPEEKFDFLSHQELHEAAKPKIAVQGTQEIIDTLCHASLKQLADKVAALSGRFDAALVKAVESRDGTVQEVPVPRRTLRTDADIDAWLAEVKQQLTESLRKGPVIIQ